jgi:DNA-binding PadR family transcriptional regulator
MLKGALIMNKKIFHGAILESVLLNLINENSESGLHGYAIYSSLNKKFGIHLGPSTIYPELKHLEKQGLVASRWEFFLGRARRQYRITRKGQGLMTEYNCQLKAIIPVSRPMELRVKNLSINQN